MRGRNVVKFQETRSKVSEKITFQYFKELNQLLACVRQVASLFHAILNNYGKLKLCV